MLRFWLAILTMSVSAASSIFAQSPAPNSSSPVVTSPRPPPSSSAAPTAEDLINSLGQVDLQAIIAALKSNFTNPDAITDTELIRATVQGLIARLPRGIMLLPGKESKSEAPNPFYSEILGGHIGYLRLGTLNGTNLQGLDKALSNFSGKKVDAVIVDLRASSVASDFGTAAEFAKRFCPKGKPLFTLHKPVARQDRAFTSDREPAFKGLVMVLADSDTLGAGEAVTAALRFHNKALVIGQPTGGGAVECSDLPLPSGKILRLAVAEMVSPDGRSLFPEGIKPDLPVEMSMADKRQIFQSSSEKGMEPFVYETGGPHMNEAALLAGINPEVDAAQVAQQRRGRALEKPPAHDAVLQRALDVITSIEIYQKR